MKHARLSPLPTKSLPRRQFLGAAAALKDISFRGHAVIELAHERDFKPTRPLRESLKKSRQFVRKVLGY